MSDKSTPGPWEAKKDGDSWRIRQKGSVKRRPGFTIERPVGEGFLSKEDARLAASAPDLLEALEQMMVCFDDGVGQPWNAKQLEAARKAIARAKG